MNHESQTPTPIKELHDIGRAAIATEAEVDPVRKPPMDPTYGEGRGPGLDSEPPRRHELLKSPGVKLEADSDTQL